MLIFVSFYLESCLAILGWIQQCSNFQFYVNLRKSVTETLAMIRQVFGEESMSSLWKNPNAPRAKKGETSEEQSQEYVHNFI
jgi:hypothetical protein